MSAPTALLVVVLALLVAGGVLLLVSHAVSRLLVPDGPAEKRSVAEERTAGLASDHPSEVEGLSNARRGKPHDRSEPETDLDKPAAGVDLRDEVPDVPWL